MSVKNELSRNRLFEKADYFDGRDLKMDKNYDALSHDDNTDIDLFIENLLKYGTIES